MLPSEREPPDVERKARLSHRAEMPGAHAYRQPRLFGFVLIVVSAMLALLLLCVAWLGLKAAWHIAGR